jgi:pimeloyl-ACP methyl ester carboxylesterase
MHYRDGGKGKPIVFVPGFAATVDAWNYQMADLHPRYRVLTLDMRGHGQSDKPATEYTYDEMCRDLSAFLRQLDLKGATLVGWSMGAGVTLKYLLDHNSDGRISRAVMVNPATPHFKKTATEPFGMDEAAAAASLEGVRRMYPETMAAFASANFHRTDLESTKQMFYRSWLEQPAYVAAKYFKTLLDTDLRDRCKDVKVPLLICQGRHDQVCDPRWAEYIQQRVSGSKLVWFENSGHSLMVEEPDKLSTELAMFVD